MVFVFYYEVSRLTAHLSSLTAISILTHGVDAFKVEPGWLTSHRSLLTLLKFAPNVAFHRASLSSLTPLDNPTLSHIERLSADTGRNEHEFF